MTVDISWDYQKQYGLIFGNDADLVRRIQHALAIISEYGGIDGDHHKQWVLDQVVRALCEEPGEYPENPRCYHKWVKLHQDGDDVPHTYEWEEGIAP